MKIHVESALFLTRLFRMKRGADLGQEHDITEEKENTKDKILTSRQNCLFRSQCKNRKTLFFFTPPLFVHFDRIDPNDPISMNARIQAAEARAMAAERALLAYSNAYPTDMQHNVSATRRSPLQTHSSPTMSAKSGKFWRVCVLLMNCYSHVERYCFIFQ
jgi:hypothetical protein